MTKILIAIFIVAAIAIVVTQWQGDRYREFMKTAQKTSARIVEKEERIANPKNKRKEHWLIYTYETKDGMTHTAQELIEYDDIWQRLRPGYPIDIYYNPAQTGQSYVALVIERRMGLK